jgi:hypothetical protein
VATRPSGEWLVVHDHGQEGRIDRETVVILDEPQRLNLKKFTRDRVVSFDAYM